jgi:hypothetical protein
MWYNINMRREFIETEVFQRNWKSCGLTENDLRNLQERLLHKPDSGESLGYGLYKIRIASGGHGRRGGSRIIYFEWSEEMRIYLLVCFPKNKQENLSVEQLQVLKTLVDRIKGGG